MISCGLGITVAGLMYYFYSLEPMDCDLLINEHARYFTFNYAEPKKIATVSSFMAEVHEKIEFE